MLQNGAIPILMFVMVLSCLFLLLQSAGYVAKIQTVLLLFWMFWNVVDIGGISAFKVASIAQTPDYTEVKCIGFARHIIV